MLRYAFLLIQFMKHCFERELAFRWNLILEILSSLLSFGFTILFFNVLYLHIPTLNGWSLQETLVLLATHQIIDLVYRAFFGKNMSRLGQLIRRGDLDSYLLRPIDIQFLCSLRFFDIKPIFSLPIPILLLSWALLSQQVVLTISNILLFLLLLIFGIFLRYFLSFFVATIALHATQISALHALQDEFMRYSSYPSVIYRGWTQLFFTWIVPVALVANVPMHILVNRPIVDFNLWALPIYMVIVIFFTRWFFIKSLAVYRSASS